MKEDEAAREIGISVASLRAMTENGWIRARRVRGEITYSSDDVQQLLASRIRAAKAADSSGRDWA